MLWREIQKTNFNDLNKLAAFLEIDPKQLSHAPRFPLNLPLRLAKKMAKNSLNDPLFRQFVPLPEENKKALNFVSDPVQDATFCKTGKLLQKYKGRALLLTTSACAMHCRFCFRQNFDYAEKSTFEEELSLIQEDPTLQEIILSGGDPLSLSDRVLSSLLTELSAIDHVKLIRFHTRFPIGIPERIDENFLQILSSIPKQIVFILHANHPNEFDAQVFTALKDIQKLGIPTLLQTVLLKDINDDFSTLKALFECTSQNGIIPYYLHQLDRVAGSAHFEVPIEKGKKLIEKLRASLPGYVVPNYVQEIPNEPNKTMI